MDQIKSANTCFRVNEIEAFGNILAVFPVKHKNSSPRAPYHININQDLLEHSSTNDFEAF